MKIVVLGTGGREHAVARKLLESTDVSEVHVIPGNFGMSLQDNIVVYPEVGASDVDAIVDKVIELDPTYVFVGPEALLAAGIVDILEERNILCLGPSKEASKLESSKAFSKEFMKKYDIPTANFVIAKGYDDSIAKLANWNSEQGYVIKCDALAAGKGVVVTDDLNEARLAVYDFTKNPKSKIRSDKIVIEEKLEGEELSFFILSDGKNFSRIGTAFDYKRVGEGNTGPNTGGMGGFSGRLDDRTNRIVERVEREVCAPVISGLKKEGITFKGILFIGLMLKGDQISVLEFNVRFGDPETQILMPLIDEDLALLFKEAAYGELKTTVVKTNSKRAVHVVLASINYPKGDIEIGLPITNIFAPTKDKQIYFAGVSKNEKNELVNSGGRVLGVTATGDVLKEARSVAYQGLSQIKMEKSFYRKDIALEERL